MRCRIFLTAWIALLLAGIAVRAQTKLTDEELHQRFARMGTTTADNCDLPAANEPADEDKIESAILEAAEDRVLEELNARATKPEQAKAIINQRLELFQKMGEDTEAIWPKENRWHFEVAEMLPAIVIKFEYRTEGHFRAFGIERSTEKGKPSQWQSLGGDHWDDYSDTPWSKLNVFPLHRGPLGAVRFLVSMQGGGCAGSYGLRYAIEEWNPEEDVSLSEAVSQNGAEGLDAEPEQPVTKKVPFSTVGMLKTEGTRITLPYCEFTQLDTWDNPSLCMVDTYDVSGDAIQFVGRRYNRPDLAPIAKALQYAKAHDLPALRGYCVSDMVAQKILRELPGGYGFDAELETLQLGGGRERVRPAYSGVPGFVVEKHSSRWLIASFDAGQE
ncbi:MAG TPA: hypothetical protein VHZ52_04570 [Acidobacteriaceae bacterium]|nr:hypothetical protein [Acidobacteriaceae bacterium]